MTQVQALAKKWMALPSVEGLRDWLARKLIMLAYKVNQDAIEEEVALSVLGNYLSCWPDDLCFEDILEALKDQEHERADEVSVWEPLENEDRDELVEDILNSTANRLYALERGFF